MHNLRSWRTCVMVLSACCQFNRTNCIGPNTKFVDPSKSRRSVSVQIDQVSKMSTSFQVLDQMFTRSTFAESVFVKQCFFQYIDTRVSSSVNFIQYNLPQQPPRSTFSPNFSKMENSVDALETRARCHFSHLTSKIEGNRWQNNSRGTNVILFAKSFFPPSFSTFFPKNSSPNRARCNAEDASVLCEGKFALYQVISHLSHHQRIHLLFHSHCHHYPHVFCPSLG